MIFILEDLWSLIDIDVDVEQRPFILTEIVFLQ